MAAAAPIIECPHVPPCGGCPLIGLDLEAQRSTKRARVAEALARFPALAGVPVAEVVRSPFPTDYRTRAKLAVDSSGGAVRIGLFLPGTHDLVDLPGCRVLVPGLRAVADRVRAALAAAGSAAAGVRHVDLRWSRAQGQAHVTLVTEGSPDGLAGVVEALQSSRLIAGVGLRSGGRGPTSRALAGETVPLAGEAALVERFAGAIFHLSPGTFFQADLATAERLVPILAEHLTGSGAGPGESLWDLYAGAGALAIPLARLGVAARVTAVESVPAAVADGEASARASATPGGGVRVRFLGARVEDLLGAALPEDRPDRIVLDPPRRGVPASVLAAAGALEPARAAYVSCAPLTLARDLAVLALHGLRAVRVVPIDLFSLTDEVEAVALLVPSPLPPPPVVFREGDVLVVDKPASLSTEFPPGRSLVGRVRALPDAAGFSPVHRLDRGTSGLVVFARGDALRRLGAALEARAVVKEYVALVRGIPHEKGTIDRPLRDRESGKARPALTRYVRERVVGGHSLLRVRIETGRLHQIRRHLAGIGHPVVGDGRHGHPPTNRHFAEGLMLARPFLHAAALTLPGEAVGRGAGAGAIRLESPLPPELVMTLEYLEKRG